MHAGVSRLINNVWGFFQTFNHGIGVYQNSTFHNDVEVKGTLTAPSIVQAAEEKTAAFTAVQGTEYLVDTTAGGVTMTLPASPTTGAPIIVYDAAKTFNTNALTVDRNGKLIDGVAANKTHAVKGSGLKYIFRNNTYGWLVKAFIFMLFALNVHAGDFTYEMNSWEQDSGLTIGTDKLKPRTAGSLLSIADSAGTTVATITTSAMTITTADISTASIDYATILTLDSSTSQIGTLSLTNALTVSNGGTGLSSLLAGRIPYGAGTGPLESDSTFKYDSAKKILHIPAIITSRANPLKDLDSDADLFRANNTNLFGSLSGTSKWYGGVLAPNGKIYGIPYSSTQVLEIDPVAGTTALFGSLSGTSKWIGGVLAPNGKIYGIPYSSTQVLEIDPVAGTTALFGSLSGAYKWIGGVLAPNGKIYGIPYDSTQVLEIDPVAGTTNLFGSLPAGTSKWYGGVLAPNGKIYGIPRSSTQVLEIDPVAGTTALFGSLSGAYKWAGGVLAPNGKIYGIPYDSTQVLEIDPVAGTTALFGSLSGTSKWAGGVLAPNGKIYGIPSISTQVLEIDPVAGTTNLFGSLSGTSKWAGGGLAPNGKIYGIPYNSTQVLEIENISGIAPTWELSAYLNKL
jgi:hypothetical protein